MSDVNYLVLHPGGDLGAIHIGNADDEQIFDTLIRIFDTKAGPIYDNYKCTTMCTFSAEDIDLVAEGNPVIIDFQKNLEGFGFELFASWHEHSQALHQLGVYEKNRFLSGDEFDNIYGPVVLRAQLVHDDTDVAVEVAVTTALYTAEKIIKAKGLSVDCLFDK